MLIIKKGDWIFGDCYQGLLSGVPDYTFKQGGLFIPVEEARHLSKALLTALPSMYGGLERKAILDAECEFLAQLSLIHSNA